MSKKKKKNIEDLMAEAIVVEKEQPFKIPDNWIWTKLGFLGEIGSSKRIKKSDWQEEGIPFYRAREIVKLNKNEEIENGIFITEELFEELKEKYGVPKENDLLITGVGTIGVPYIVKKSDKFYFKDASVIWYKNKFGLNAKFIKFFYESPITRDQIMKMSSGTTVDTYTITNANNTLIPLPPRKEQIRITDKLERLLYKIDEAKQLIEEVKETFETRRMSILNKAFRGQLGTNRPNETAIDLKVEKLSFENKKDIYEIPKNWIWVKSETVAKWGSGGTPSRRKPEYYNGSIPWIKTGELRDDIIYDSEEKISEDAIKNSSAKIFPKGAVAIAMYGATIGRTGILGIEAATNQACAVGIPNHFTSKEFMFYYFQSQRQKLVDRGKGGAQPNISQTIIKNYPFPLPPLAEQERIVNKLKVLLKKLDEEQEITKSLELQLDNLKKSILLKAFRGELGTNDPSEESSIELLKDIILKQVK